VVVCLEQGADLHMAQLMPLPLSVSCFSKIQIGFTFLIPTHLSSPGKRAVKRVCVCVGLIYGERSMHLLGIRLSVPSNHRTTRLQVCCCEPGRQVISIDCCTGIQQQM